MNEDFEIERKIARGVSLIGLMLMISANPSHPTGVELVLAFLFTIVIMVS